MRAVVTALGALLCLFVLVEVNYPRLGNQSSLAVFTGLGLVLCFLLRPPVRRGKTNLVDRISRVVLAVGGAFVCGYVVVQNEPAFQSLWPGGLSLGDRAAEETSTDLLIGTIGLLLILEATRRAIGWALPILATTFIVYALIGPHLPDFLFPHRGYDWNRLVAQTFLQSQGVFGTATYVMFKYVFLFVVFGAFLKQTGATQWVIDVAQSVFHGSPGAPAKVAVLSSGLMGSLSGSAVANTATTGTFTIPMMRSSGFKPHVAAGVEAAASSGGALVPPVMGAGAYMMLEIIDPPVTYLQIVRAALIPALLYYLSLILIVHFTSRRLGIERDEVVERKPLIWKSASGLVFFAAFGVLIGQLIAGNSVFRAVSWSLLAIAVVGAIFPATRLGPKRILDALRDSARDVVPLVSAAACVGIIIGIVVLTGVGNKLPASILTLSEDNLFIALFLIMVSSIVLGMGLPSAVCYLLMATLIGPVLSELGVVPLGAHLFIFYFGMMSMVTPPVALAAYTAGTIAGAGIMRTGVTAFRFALVGFTLPYMFVYRPQLLMLDDAGDLAGFLPIAGATLIAALGILALAAAIAGFLLGPLTRVGRGVATLSAATLLAPLPFALGPVPLDAVAGLLLLGWVAFHSRRAAPAA